MILFLFCVIYVISYWCTLPFSYFHACSVLCNIFIWQEWIELIMRGNLDDYHSYLLVLACPALCKIVVRAITPQPLLLDFMTRTSSTIVTSFISVSASYKDLKVLVTKELDVISSNKGFKSNRPLSCPSLYLRFKTTPLRLRLSVISVSAIVIVLRLLLFYHCD